MRNRFCLYSQENCCVKSQSIELTLASKIRHWPKCNTTLLLSSSEVALSLLRTHKISRLYSNSCSAWRAGLESIGINKEQVQHDIKVNLTSSYYWNCV